MAVAICLGDHAAGMLNVKVVRSWLDCTPIAPPCARAIWSTM
jgi:hypothetical protein